MRRIGFEREDLHWCAALAIPLIVRCAGEGVDQALRRVAVLAVVFVTACLWSALIRRSLWPAPLGRQLHFALLFSLLLFEPGGWVATLFAVSFGWVFAYEMFGGKPVLSPALVALAVALFSFPEAGFQELWIINAPPAISLALACLPGALWLAWRKRIALPVLAGVVLGVAGTVALFPPSTLWWEQMLIGTLVTGCVFVAADRTYLPDAVGPQLIYGALIGVLIMVLRLASPDQPDGVVFAILLASLFAPLLGKLMAWRPGHG